MTFAKLSATSIGVIFACSLSVKAQTVNPDILRSVRQCQGADCRTIAVRAARDIKKQGLSAEVHNSQIGVLAGLLFERARGDTSPRAGRDAARAIESLAAYSSDPLQRKSLLNIAKAIRTGIASELDLDLPVAASPS
ncbi:MAG: hypothetical protein KUG58_08165 [Marinosulfonomonas sp.]|nr:hypothetical protein [Marinosulfonomonas sp.]